MNRTRQFARVALLIVLATIGCRGVDSSPPSSTSIAEPSWTPLFDGTSLGDWTITPFGGSGPVEVRDGAIELGQGSPMTGVTYHGEFPRDDYELEMDAARVLGTDFFCALTFPVGDAHLTLVLGGWGGGLCGLSCLDGLDASSNETKCFRRFERGRSYRVRLRVAGGRVQAWLDGEPLIDADLRGRALSLRPEVEPGKPLGIASYATIGRISAFRLRRA